MAGLAPATMDFDKLLKQASSKQKVAEKKVSVKDLFCLGGGGESEFEYTCMYTTNVIKNMYNLSISVTTD